MNPDYEIQDRLVEDMKFDIVQRGDDSSGRRDVHKGEADEDRLLSPML